MRESGRTRSLTFWVEDIKDRWLEDDVFRLAPPLCSLLSSLNGKDVFTYLTKK